MSTTPCLFPLNLQEVKADLESAALQGESLWEKIIELSSAGIVLIVEFAKKIPGFLSLSTADQITLLRAACLEIMILRFSIRYDPDTDTMQFSNGMILSREQLQSGGLGPLTTTIFSFAAALKRMECDETEYAMLSSICLISGDRSGLQDTEKIEAMQEPLLEALKHYIRSRRPDQPHVFAKMLMKLTDLRSISVKGEKQLAPHGLDCLHDMLASPLSPQHSRRQQHRHHHHHHHQQQQQHLAWVSGRGGRVAETATSATLRSPTSSRHGQEGLAQRLSSSSPSPQLLSFSASSPPSSFSLPADRAYNGGRSRGLSRHHSGSTRGFGSGGRGSEGSGSNLLGPDLESVVPGDFISDSGNGLSSTRPPPAPHALSIDTSEGLSSLSPFDSNGRANKPSTVYLNRWETKQQQQQQQHPYQYSHQRLSLLSEVSRNNKPMGALEVIVKAVEQPTYDDIGSSTFTLPPRSPVDPHSTSGNLLSSPLGSTGFFSVGSLRHNKASSASSSASSSSSAAHFTASSANENLQRGSGSVFSTSSIPPPRTPPSSSSVISLLDAGGSAGSFLHSQFSSLPPSEPASLMYARRSDEFLSPTGLSSHAQHAPTSRDYQQQGISLSPSAASPNSLSPLATHPNFLSRGSLLNAPRVTPLSAEALSELRHQQQLQHQQQQQQLKHQQQQQQNLCEKNSSSNSIDFTGNYTIINNNNNSLLAPASLSKDICGDHGLKTAGSGGGGEVALGQGIPGDAAAMPMWVWELRESSGGSAIYRPDLVAASGRTTTSAGSAGNLLRHSVESSSSDEVLGVMTHASTGLPPVSGGATGRHPDFRDDGENKPTLSIGQLIGGAMKIEPGDWMDYPDQQ
ncbi:retinoic acid receptor [Elysia marginata]|uniref:Retinoic acid receptor n=1 Tax=Elysia marginata TaxID=1093978 RepID=A0AAV4GJL2_9GAST|nr:retinoic acid receptor [Elysia marginata]